MHLKNDGSLLVQDFLTPDNKKEKDEVKAPFSLPFGLKLSNNLPDFKFNKYQIDFTDDKTHEEYSIKGADTSLADFTYNKQFRAALSGKVFLDGSQAFDYNVKLLNRIMPEGDINDLLAAAPDTKDDKKDKRQEFNILESLRILKKSGLKGSLFADIKTSGTFESPKFDGNIDLSGLSLLSAGKYLPDSSLKLVFKDNKVKIDSNINTSINENTKISGEILSGENPKLNLSCKSNANLKSVFEIADTLAQIFGIDDLKTLKAKGALDIDFNIDSNFKKINSNGKIKLTGGVLSWGLYDVKIDNLAADILLNNNSVIINRAGFSTLSVPLDNTNG